MKSIPTPIEDQINICSCFGVLKTILLIVPSSFFLENLFLKKHFDMIMKGNGINITIVVPINKFKLNFTFVSSPK